MRLKDSEVSIIKDAIKNFDENAEIILFGSRVDDNAKGGDIDLLIISDKIKNSEKRKIRLKIFDQLEEQKIDIIATSGIKGAFIEYAYKSGVRL
jgi:predicted nucleotidyltransferase